MSGAIYTIKADKVPESLSLSAEVLDLVQRDYSGYDFKDELELVARSADRVEATTPRVQSDGALNLNEGVAAAAVAKAPSASASVASGSGSSSASASASGSGSGSASGSGSVASASSASAAIPPQAAIATTPAAAAAAAAAAASASAAAKEREEALAKDSQVTAMVLQTGQGRDECLFYLESCNWDVPSAVRMLNEFTQRD